MKFIFDKDSWQEIFGSIKKSKLRTAITVIGVLWGVFLFITLLGAAKGMEFHQVPVRLQVVHVH